MYCGASLNGRFVGLDKNDGGSHERTRSENKSTEGFQHLMPIAGGLVLEALENSTSVHVSSTDRKKQKGARKEGESIATRTKIMPKK